VIINMASRAGTVGQPDTAAYGATGFLASPRAAYITGTNIAVDGGRAVARQLRTLDTAS
jgi:NAD(P)-dependent dehydrogenase (short-subunit alcohol dehydrogenase family)